MNTMYYELLGLQFKTKNDIPQIWEEIVNEVDEWLVDFMKSFKIDMDTLYTTNVGLLNFKNSEKQVILWDLSYWVLYLRYLDFVFWMERESENNDDEYISNAKYPYYLKENVLNNNRTDAQRLNFLPSIFEYLSYKFYNEYDISYCFALLRNENMNILQHSVPDETLDQYKDYIKNQLMLAKLFAAFHETYHLKSIDPPGGYDFFADRIDYNLRLLIESTDFNQVMGHDPILVKDARKKVAGLNREDSFFDELYADAAALDLMDTILNDMHIFYPEFSLDEFSVMMKTMIENFYAFNTMTYDLYTIWKSNVELIKGHLDEATYKKDIHEQDIDGTIRGLIFPIVLWIQIDRFCEERNNSPGKSPKRSISVRSEMIDFYDIAYNWDLKCAIESAIKNGFYNSKLSISDARDILIGWNELYNFPRASEKDLFLKGGYYNEDDFYVFVRRY